MTEGPDRWQKLEELYHAALERPESERARFLAEACQGDERLLGEVGSLLGLADEAGRLLDQPVAEAETRPLSLVPGSRVGSYRIVEPIGFGGMGEVYRATDTKLGREVAIKALPRDVGDDAGRLARFIREARVLATVNHPNIAAIHGLEESGGRPFLVLELVAGEDLARRLERGPLPLDEALEIATQIADGLEEAHERGIVHRDLKPANVQLVPDGRVKILDFGLARKLAPGGTPGASPLSRSPSAAEATTEGTVLGTAAYMSPEQTRGRRVDRRADVWAFGAVLFEMLTGRRAFAGETTSDVLAAVLSREPDWAALPEVTPEPVRRLLRRCLEKDPKARLRDIGDARIELRDARAAGRDTARPSATGPAPHGPGVRGLWTAAAILASLAIGTIARDLWTARSPVGPRPEIRLQRLTEYAGIEETPAISRDGKTVAFIAAVNGMRQVFVRPLAEGAPVQVTREDADHSFPRWANENTLVYYLHPPEGDGALGSLWETLVLSSTPPRLIGPAQGEADVSHEGGRIATFREGADGPELVIVERGGERIEAVRRLPILSSTTPRTAYSSPRWSPDDRQIAFQVMVDLANAEIRVMDLGDDETATIKSTGQMRGLAWLPDGSGLVYGSAEGSTLPYPPSFGLRVVNLDGSDDAPLPLADAGYASYVEPDVTTSRELVASRIQAQSDVFRFPVDGSPRENVRNARRITRQTGQVQVPSVSPSGEEVAYLSDSGGHANVWIARVDGSQPPRQVTDEHDPQVTIGIPVWSPAGEWIAYYRNRVGGVAEQWLVRPDGTGQRRLAETTGAASWSQDGEWLYHNAPRGDDPEVVCVEKVHVDGGPPQRVRCGGIGLLVGPGGDVGYFSPSNYRLGEVWRVRPLDSETPEPLVTGLGPRLPLWPHHYHLSTDGRWLATPLTDRGTTNLWAISTADGSLRQLTDFGRRATTIGRQVSWSRDGRYVFAALLESDADVVLVEGVLP